MEENSDQTTDTPGFSHPDFLKYPMKRAKVLYYMEHKEALFKEDPLLRNVDESNCRKILWERFLSLDVEQKAVYEEKTAKLMKEYLQKWEKFMKDHPDHAVSLRHEYSKMVKKHYLKHSDYPKTPRNACKLFFLEHKDEVLEQNPEFHMKHVKEILHKKFQNLDDDERAVYVYKAAEAMKEFEQFKKDHPDWIAAVNAGRSHKQTERSLLAATSLQSDSDTGDAAVEVGIKREVSEDESDCEKKNKKPRLEAEKEKN